MKNIVTLITIFAIFAHAVAGCCWHLGGSPCCGDNDLSGVASLSMGQSHDRVCHLEQGHSDLHEETSHTGDACSQESEPPQKRPGRHCEDNSCVVVLDSQSSATEMDFLCTSGTLILVSALFPDIDALSSHTKDVPDSLWSPLDRALAHQVLLI